MAVLLRRLVSTNKRRYQQHGYDLDLSYITHRIIAMGFPCDGVSRLYRNPLDDVVRLLEERHAGHYKVYNLCVERGYDPRVFKGRVMRVPMYDGQAPPLQLMADVCLDAAAWLAAHPEHVVAVHCKAGKGRTGAVVCALLMALDPELGPASLGKTLAFWAERRTKDSKGLCIPSQRRFVSHFHQLLLTACASCTAPAANGAANAGLHIGGQQQLGDPKAAPAPQLQSQQQQPAPQPAHGGLWPQRGIPSLLAAAAVPHRPVKLLRVRFRGLPRWLLRDCTASVWWRPVGHHEAYAVCHVRTSTSGGCAGHSPEGQGPGGAATWSFSPHDTSGGSGGVRGGGASSAQDLCVDLSGLSPPFQPPSPSPLSYYTPYTTQSDGGALPAGGAGPGSSNAAAPGMPLSARSPGLDTTGSRCSGKQTQDASGYEPNNVAAGAKPGPLVVSGDVKIQLFRGAIADPPHDVFKGSVTQFSAWVCTAYLDPRVGALELGRAELDKLSKRLRRWPGAVGIVLEYESL